MKALGINVGFEHTTHVPDMHCTNCNRKVNTTTGPDKPNPGDISICIYCVHLSIFDEQLQLREPTHDELLEVAGDRELIILINAVGITKKRMEQSHENNQDK